MFKVGMLIRSKVNPHPIYKITKINRELRLFDCKVVMHLGGGLAIESSEYRNRPLYLAVYATDKDKKLVKKLRREYKDMIRKKIRSNNK